MASSNDPQALDKRLEGFSDTIGRVVTLKPRDEENVGDALVHSPKRPSI